MKNIIAIVVDIKMQIDNPLASFLIFFVMTIPSPKKNIEIFIEIMPNPSRNSKLTSISMTNPVSWIHQLGGIYKNQ
jgi:hypothetical protein